MVTRRKGLTEQQQAVLDYLQEVGPSSAKDVSAFLWDTPWQVKRAETLLGKLLDLKLVDRQSISALGGRWSFLRQP